MADERRRKARRRALRAAQVVTLGLAIAGCGQSHESTDDAGSDAMVMVDSGIDSGFDAGFDSGFDAGFDAGACTDFPPTTRECCEADPGGWWDEESDMCLIAVPGPFVPPRMV